jgi:hypothetical protein
MVSWFCVNCTSVTAAALCRQDNEWSDWVTVGIRSDLDHLEPRKDLGPFGHIFGEFDTDDYLAVGPTLYGELHVHCSRKRGVTTGPRSVDPTVMHQNDEAIEELFDFGRGREIGRHVLILRLRPDEAAVQGVDEHDTWRHKKLGLDVCY